MRTEQGKNISSQNSIKHGGCSEKHLIVRDERIQDFEELEDMWMHSYQPRDAAEHHMVEQLTRADWFYQRAERNMAEVEVELMNSGSPADWTEEQEKKLARMQRYLTARSNLFAKKGVSQTMNSKHITGDAVDLYPTILPEGWQRNPKVWLPVLNAVKQAATEQGVKLRYGINWKNDPNLPIETKFVDAPHVELA